MKYLFEKSRGLARIRIFIKIAIELVKRVAKIKSYTRGTHVQNAL